MASVDLGGNADAEIRGIKNCQRALAATPKQTPVHTHPIRDELPPRMSFTDRRSPDLEIER